MPPRPAPAAQKPAPKENEDPDAKKRKRVSYKNDWKTKIQSYDSKNSYRKDDFQALSD